MKGILTIFVLLREVFVRWAVSELAKFMASWSCEVITCMGNDRDVRRKHLRIIQPMLARTVCAGEE